MSIERDEQGVDRCRRAVQAVMPNDPKNPTAGYKRVTAYCNKPITFSVAEGKKVCPDCDKQPPVGWVNPRKTNAAGIVLTKKELEECGLSEDPALSIKPIEASKAVEAIKVEAKKDEVILSVPLGDLESNSDIAAYLIQKVLSGFGALPVTNYAESKRLMKLEEKLEALVRA